MNKIFILFIKIYLIILNKGFIIIKILMYYYSKQFLFLNKAIVKFIETYAYRRSNIFNNIIIYDLYFKKIFNRKQL